VKAFSKGLLLAGAAASAVAGTAVAGARRYEYDALGRIIAKYTDGQGCIVAYTYTIDVGAQK